MADAYALLAARLPKDAKDLNAQEAALRLWMQVAAVDDKAPSGRQTKRNAMMLYVAIARSMM